jgi:hypothetical protein
VRHSANLAASCGSVRLSGCACRADPVWARPAWPATARWPWPNDIRGRGSLLVLIQNVGIGRWGWSRWPTGWAAAELVSDCLDAFVTDHPRPIRGRVGWP